MISEKEKSQRNRQLVSFFKKRNLSVRLVGLEDKPLVIVDNSWVISGYVRNFKFVFLDKLNNGNVLAQVRLDDSSFTKEDLQRLLQKSNHKLVLKICLEGTDLFLAGFSKDNQPFFSRSNPRIYLDQNSVLEIVKKYYNYKLVIDYGNKSYK